MEEQGSYAWLHHTGDAGIDAEAPDLPALFSACARALFEVVAGEGCRIDPRETVELSVKARAPDLLLLEWLRELHHLHESGGWLFCSFQVKVESGRGPSWRLEARARGERLDPRRHRLETEVKAVTYHQLSVRGDDGAGWRARVIFDI